MDLFLRRSRRFIDRLQGRWRIGGGEPSTSAQLVIISSGLMTEKELHPSLRRVDLRRNDSALNLTTARRVGQATRAGVPVVSWRTSAFVFAHNSTLTYKRTPVDVKAVGRDLGVRDVLQGSVRRFGSHVRVTGQLIDTATAAHVWADRYDGTLGDLFTLQDEMTMSVIGAVEPNLRARVRLQRHHPRGWARIRPPSSMPASGYASAPTIR